MNESAKLKLVLWKVHKLGEILMYIQIGNWTTPQIFLQWVKTLVLEILYPLFGPYPSCIKDPLVILICVLEAFMRILTKVDWIGGLRIAWLLFHFSMRIIHSSQSLQMISIYPCDHSFGLWYFGVFSLLGVEEIPAPEWMLDFIVFRLVCNRVAFWVLTE